MLAAQGQEHHPRHRAACLGFAASRNTSPSCRRLAQRQPKLLRLVLLPPRDARGRVHGIGPVTAARMNKLGIHTGLDLRQQTLEFLTGQFGRAGSYYYGVARAEDDRPVVAERQPKSIGAETTFARDLLAWDEVTPALEPVFAKVWAAYGKDGLVGRTVTVKVKYADFQQVTRSRSCVDAVTSQATLERMSLDLLRPLFPPRLGVRLLGVTLSNLAAETSPMQRQLALLEG